MSKENTKGRTLFKIFFVIFIAIVLGVLYDMSSKTTAPWNKKKQIERAIE